jgi:predicted NAD/FAD-binding protein
MLWEIPKFYRSVRTLYPNLDPATTLGDLLARGRYGSTYRQLHILPMASAIWSTPFESILRFPARDFVRFYEEHGLLRFTRRPRWRTVTGGSREYVRRLMADCALDERRATRVHRVRRSTAGVAVTSERGEESFDVAVLAVHGSDALALIADPRPGELDVLAAFRSSPSRALLHRDPSFMPRRRAAWSSWNYHARTGQPADRQVPVTYWMNRLQNIDPTQPLFVSLNPWREPAPESVFGEFHYRHPTFTPETTRAARCLASIQGRHGLWFCGAYTRYGFHEDGLRSGFAVAAALGSPPPWGMLGVAPADSEAPAPEVRLATV